MKKYIKYSILLYIRSISIINIFISTIVFFIVTFNSGMSFLDIYQKFPILSYNILSAFIFAFISSILYNKGVKDEK